MGLVMGVIPALVWLGLLIHWMGKTEFYPIAGKGWRTKIFWGVGLLTLNPAMALLYFIYGVKMRPSETPPRHLKRSRVIVFPFFGLSLLLALPIGRLPDKPRIVVSDTPRKAYDLSSKATIRISSNATTVSGGFGFENITFLDARRIAILNKSRDPLAVKTAQILQQYLLKSPAVDEVSYYPAGTSPRDGARLPGIYIIMDVERVSAPVLPMMHMTSAKVDFKIKAAQALAAPWLPLPMGKQDTAISINHESTTLGYESYAAKYSTAAEDIVKTLFVHLKSMIGTTWYASLPQPPVPDNALGTCTPTPPMPFDDDTIREMISGTDLLTHNHTTWWVEEVRSTDDALALYRKALEEDGWVDDSDRDTFLRMHRGQEELRVYRSDNPLKKGSYLPMIARYRNPFSAEETDAVLAGLLNADYPLYTLLFFGRQFRETQSTDIMGQFRERIASEEPKSMQGHLELARFWASQGEKDKASEELTSAVGGLSLRQDGSSRIELRRLAEDLGVPELADALPTEKMIQQYGLIPLARITTNLTLTVSAEEPVGFYLFQDHVDDRVDKGASLRTYVFKIVQDPFKITPVLGWKTLPNNYWALVYNGNNSIGMHSWSFTEGQTSKGLWHAAISEQVPEPLDRIQVEVTQVGTEKFEFTVTPLKRQVPTIPDLLKL